MFYCRFLKMAVSLHQQYCLSLYLYVSLCWWHSSIVRRPLKRFLSTGCKVAALVRTLGRCAGEVTPFTTLKTQDNLYTLFFIDEKDFPYFCPGRRPRGVECSEY